MTWKERLLLPLTSVLIVFGAVEGLARVMGWGEDLESDYGYLIRNIDGDVEEAFNQEDAWAMWRPIPDYKDGIYEIGPHGFRDRVYDSVDVVALGDSSTFGFGVPQPQLWHEHLEHALKRPTLSMGVTGYTAAQGLALFRREGAALKPKVVIAYFGINELQTRFHLSDPEILSMAGPAALQSTAEALGGLRIWTLIRGAVSALRAGEDRNVARLSPGQLRDSLVALDDEVRAAGAELVLVSPPVCRQRTGDWPHLAALKAVRSTLELVAAERNVPLVIVPEMTEDATVDAPHLFLDSVHPSPEGHALLARAVETAVRPLLD